MEVTSYAPGTPSWADVSSTDIPTTAAFYSALFGWNSIDFGPDAGNYNMFHVGDKPVAAAGPNMGGGPNSWSTYITVADADETAALITAKGGTVIVEPMDVMDVGRMAIAFDPTGGAFSIWQPRAHIGAYLVNEPNTMCWNELTVRDVDAAIAFYTAVFGWSVRENDMGGGVIYREMLLGENSVAGCMPMGDEFPAEVPTHWMVYFSVDDCDAMAARITELGGEVCVPPSDIPGIGRFAVANDPTGATFSILQPNPRE